MGDATANEHMLDHLYLLIFSENYLGLCGCNDPQAGVELAEALLRIFAKPDWTHEEIRLAIGGNEGTHHIVLSAFTRSGLAEHGSSVWASWPTPIGRWFLWAVDQLGVAGLVERLEHPNNVGYPDHNGECCTKACWVVPKNAGRATT